MRRTRGLRPCAGGRRSRATAARSHRAGMRGFQQLTHRRRRSTWPPYRRRAFTATTISASVRTGADDWRLISARLPSSTRRRAGSGAPVRVPRSDVSGLRVEERRVLRRAQLLQPCRARNRLDSASAAVCHRCTVGAGMDNSPPPPDRRNDRAGDQFSVTTRWRSGFAVRGRRAMEAGLRPADGRQGEVATNRVASSAACAKRSRCPGGAETLAGGRYSISRREAAPAARRKVVWRSRGAR